MYTFFLLFIAFTYSIIASSLGSLLNIPKRVEQNQTRTFDRDKLLATSNSSSHNNFTVPNSISDSSKVATNNFKIISNKYSSSSDGNKFHNASNNKSSSLNQLNATTTMIPVVEETSFSTVNFTNITAQVGSIVEIPCTVHHLAEGTVSFHTHTSDLYFIKSFLNYI